MRTPDLQQQKMFFYFSAESRIPQDHPLRPIKVTVDAILKSLDEQFNRMYSVIGRSCIAPERLLRALMLQILYSNGSERSLIEHMDFNILFRWFIGLHLDEPVGGIPPFPRIGAGLLKETSRFPFLMRSVRKPEAKGCSPTIISR